MKYCSNYRCTLMKIQFSSKLLIDGWRILLSTACFTANFVLATCIKPRPLPCCYDNKCKQNVVFHKGWIPVLIIKMILVLRKLRRKKILIILVIQKSDILWMGSNFNRFLVQIRVKINRPLSSYHGRVLRIFIKMRQGKYVVSWRDNWIVLVGLYYIRACRQEH